MRLVLSFVLFVFAWQGSVFAEKATQKKEVRPIMGQVFADISLLFPLSLDPEGFKKSDNKKPIMEALGRLSKSSRQLVGHVDDWPYSYKKTADKFSRAAEHSRKYFAAGKPELSQHIVRGMTQTCISCHVTAGGSSSQTQFDKFFGQLLKETLSPIELARLSTMSRNFDQAEKSYETQLSNDPKMILEPTMREYLLVKVGVKSDISGLIPVLEANLKHPSANQTSKARAKQFLSDAKKLNAKKALAKKNGGTKAIRDLIKTSTYQASLLNYVVALSHLNRALDVKTPDPEHLFLMGKAKNGLSPFFWVSDAEFYFEEAIVKKPSAPWAQEAMDALRDIYTFGYSGSSGTKIPSDVKTKLETLQAKIDGSKKPANL